ncbi:MAG TPA: hypothetical protein VGF14_07475 [Alphaproteobacteria bacterium]
MPGLKMKRIALISMCDGIPTPGLRALEELAGAHGRLVGTYDIRIGEPLPDLDDFDLLLSSGGPGDPRELGNWGQAYIDLIERIRLHNENNSASPKHVFLVCHSFQMISQAWGLGALSRRDEALWGIHPQKAETLPGDAYPVFPTTDFYTLESRFYQVMPVHDLNKACEFRDIVIAAHDEKGALTAWQTRDGHIAATQFHPEALAETIAGILDNPPSDPKETINAADRKIRDLTRERLPLIAPAYQALVNFLQR